jgi:lipopolysaccharide export system protein LptC
MTRRRQAKEAVAQPLGRIAAAATAHPRSDWSARAHVTTGDAQRYSRFVVIMKRVLLIAALVLIAVVTAYSIQPRQPQTHVTTLFERLGLVAGDLTMVRPRLTGKDDDGNPFVVTADSAIQDAHNARRAKLNTVEFDSTLKDGGWVNVTATHGLLDASTPPPPPKTSAPRVKQKAAKGKLMLKDNVAMFTDQGYEMHSDLAYIDLDRGLVVGPHPVRGQGPLGTMRADKFWLKRVPIAQSQAAAPAPPPPAAGPAKVKAHPPTTATQIFLVGNVHMILYVNGNKKNGAKKK